jgi:hypothetical protein
MVYLRLGGFTAWKPRSPSAQLLDNEKKVHPMSPEKPDTNVRDYGDDFTFQAVQELLQLGLVRRHPDIEPMYPVFHLPTLLWTLPRMARCGQASQTFVLSISYAVNLA